MANFFDQFDQQPTPAQTKAPATGGNFFDQFDGAPAATAAPAVATPSTAADMAYSFAAGVPRGLAETIMLPVSASRALKGGMEYVYNKGEDALRYALGLDPVSADVRQRQHDLNNTGLNVLNKAQDAVRGVMDDNLYQPRTTPGEYARTAGEFVAPGSIPSKATRVAPNIARKAGEYATDLLGNVVMPALLSEGAGQATEGTAWEGPARVAGALVGNMGVAAGRAYNAPESVIRRATGDMTDADWARARALQNNSTGVKLTGPEAIAQARDGASALPNIQRVVEGSIEGRARTGPFFAERPAQVDAAMNDVLDAIAPQSAQPSTLGAKAARVAEDAISASPEGAAFLDALHSAGPRTTALDAGTSIQAPLRRVFDRREGMRAALGDADFNAARSAEASIPVSGLAPETTTVRPAYTSIKPVAAEGDNAAAMVPEAVPAKTQTPSLTSATGPEAIQADPRDVLKFIDDLAPTTKASARAALQKVRASLFDKGGVDTSVTGLDATRNQLNDMINVATRSGENNTASVLLQVRDKLDSTLSAVPEYGKAKANFAAASAPLEPFTSPGMAKAIAKDEYNTRFTTAPENVPAALSTPSEAKNFASVAPTEARAALENHLVTQMLDGATDTNGAVNVNALARSLQDNRDLLAQFPGVADRLNGVIKANAGVDAVRAGPLGRVASASDTAAAGSAILPQNPLTGSAQETADAVAALVAKDPTLIPQLVRQTLADRASRAATETMEGGREFAGAKFHKTVAGNPQRQEVLDAVLRSLPNDTSQQMNDLLDVLQATGRRKPIGSATEFNRSINVELGDASPVARLFGLARSLGTSLITNAGDATRRAALRGNLDTLAKMFIDPQSVDLMRAANSRGKAIVVPEALARTAAETSPLYDRERGPR